jgi:glycogen debranching enzyme
MVNAFVLDDIFCAWRGPVLLVTDRRGGCGTHPLSGFYFREARYLRTLRVEINGCAPWLCEAASVGPECLQFNYVYPEISAPGGGGTGQSGDEEVESADGLPERSLDILLSYRAAPGRLRVDVRVTNRARRAVTFELACALDADFADILEALPGRRQQDAPVEAVASGGRVELRYRHPALPFRTVVESADWLDAGADDHPRAGRLSTSVTLAPQQTRTFRLTVVPFVGDHAVSDAEARERDDTRTRWQAAFTRIEAPGNRLLEAVVKANVDDIASFPLLDGTPDEWLRMQAGMPAYPAFFGRDAVTAGWQAGLLDRGEALEAAFVSLARLQAHATDEWRDAQPGRIPYQVRSGPLAVLNLNPYSAYYADFASPLMFVISLANLYAWTGDVGRVRRFWDAARRMLDWARTHGDADGDGYLEYQTRSREGTKNQGWKDSGDAIVYDDGSPVPAPIATCELQGYWYVAQELMGLLALAMGARGDADAWWRSAADLKARFNRDWWIDEHQFFALALDPDKRPVTAVTSNVGHCLATGIIAAEHLPAVVGRLFAPDLFSGWGIRTLSAAHAFYNPVSYHRGSVWAVEQATTVFGLRRFGFTERALELTRALFDLALLYPGYRIPECVGGYARGERATPGAYPRANTPQLWNATAFPLVLQAMLGLVPLAPAQTLVIDPVLPTWMPEVVLRQLRVGEATVSLRFRRERDGTCSWQVLHRSGTLHIVRQPPPESLSAGLGERLRDLLQTAV